MALYDIPGLDDLIAEQALHKRELEEWQRGVEAARPGALAEVEALPHGGYITRRPGLIYWSQACDESNWPNDLVIVEGISWIGSDLTKIAAKTSLRNGLRRPKGRRDPDRWQDRRVNRRRWPVPH